MGERHGMAFGRALCHPEGVVQVAAGEGDAACFCRGDGDGGAVFAVGVTVGNHQGVQVNPGAGILRIPFEREGVNAMGDVQGKGRQGGIFVNDDAAVGLGIAHVVGGDQAEETFVAAVNGVDFTSGVFYFPKNLMEVTN